MFKNPNEKHKTRCILFTLSKEKSLIILNALLLILWVCAYEQSFVRNWSFFFSFQIFISFLFKESVKRANCNWKYLWTFCSSSIFPTTIYLLWSSRSLHTWIYTIFSYLFSLFSVRTSKRLLILFSFVEWILKVIPIKIREIKLHYLGSIWVNLNYTIKPLVHSILIYL